MINDFIFFFFYGTLKEDGELHPQIKEYLLSDKIKVKAFGCLYKSTYGNWPIMILDDKNYVYGELFQVKDEILKIIYHEELFYGYSLKLVDIYNLDNSYHTKALTCLWDNEFDKNNIIKSGEWINN